MYSSNTSSSFYLLLAMVVAAVSAQPTRAEIFEEFLFNDPAGTHIPDAANTGTGGHQFDTDEGTGGDANADVVTNGLGQLNASLKNNDFFGTNYSDTDNITSGRVFGVMELTWDFQSVFNPSADEEIRITLTNNDPRGTQVTAQVEIQRTGTSTININGVASTSGEGATNIADFPLNITQSAKFIALVDADLDNDVYSVLFSDDAGSSFTSIGSGSLAPTRIVNAMRFVLNEDFVGDNVLIDRVYLTDVNPAVNVDLLTLEVNSTTGLATLKNDTGVSFDIDHYRIESPTDDLNFATWNSLSDQEYDAIDGPDADSIVGNGVGETWDEAGGSDDGILSESFLLSSSVFDPAESVGLGHGFQVGGDLSMLNFQYRDAITGNLFIGNIVEVTGASADFDLDGDIDGNDFLILQRGLGLTGQVNNSNGDADGSGTVDSADLAVWEAQYGTNPLSAVSAAVPEPTTGGLVALALATTMLGFRKRLTSS